MAATTASCVEIDTIDQLRSYETVWRELFAQSSQPSVFATWEWMFSLLRYFGGISSEFAASSRSPLVLIQVHAASNELVALVPLHYGHQSGGRTRIPILLMVGDVESDRANPTQEPIVLLKRGFERDAVAAVLVFLRYFVGSSDWNYVTLALPYIPEPALPSGTMTAAVRKVSASLSRQRIFTAEIIDLPESWSNFLQSLSKSLRDNLKYYPRLIERHGHTCEIRVARTPAEVSAAAEILAVLHRRRNICTEENPRADHLPYEANLGFLTECLSALAAREMATIYLLEIDGEAVAAQSLLEGPEGICFYYSGFDPDWFKYSPLTILTAEIIRDAIERGVSRVNLLADALPWKVRWGAKSVNRYARMVRVRRHLPGLLRCAAYYCSKTYSNRTRASHAKHFPDAFLRETKTRSTDRARDWWRDRMV